jgi:hypothetical protein
MNPRCAARRLARWTVFVWFGLWVALAGTPPAEAANFSIAGGSNHTAWSGYWWPMLVSRGFHLYDQTGTITPLLNYAQATGDMGPLNWERRYKMTSDPSNDWWGHCNGWAASTVLEPEPTRAVRAGSVVFSVGEIKGLLAVAHQGDPNDFFAGLGHLSGGDINTDLRASDFHRAVLYYLRDRSETIIFNVTDKPQVWNYPAYSFQMSGVTSRNSPNATQVTTTLTFGNDNVQPDFVGTNWFNRTYTYTVQGDPLSTNASITASWTGNSVFDHPQFVWHPAFQRANEPAFNEPPNPLNYSYVQQLVQASTQ